MIEPDVTGWKHIGKHGNSTYYEAAPNVVAIVPDRGTLDDLSSARQSVAYQHDYFRQRGTPGVVLIFFDLIASLEPAARKVYQQEIDPQLIAGAGLIGGSLLSRAMGSFFMGLAKPRVPLRMFGDVQSAIDWGNGLLSARAKP